MNIFLLPKPFSCRMEFCFEQVTLTPYKNVSHKINNSCWVIGQFGNASLRKLREINRQLKEHVPIRKLYTHVVNHSSGKWHCLLERDGGRGGGWWAGELLAQPVIHPSSHATNCWCVLVFIISPSQSPGCGCGWGWVLVKMRGGCVGMGQKA